MQIEYDELTTRLETNPNYPVSLFRLIHRYVLLITLLKDTSLESKVVSIMDVDRRLPFASIKDEAQASTLSLVAKWKEDLLMVKKDITAKAHQTGILQPHEEFV